MFEQSKPGTTAEVPTVKINIPENDDILRCPAASDGENVSHFVCINLLLIPGSTMSISLYFGI